MGAYSDPSARNVQHFDLTLGQNAAALQLWLAVDQLRAWYATNDGLRPSKRKQLPAAIYDGFKHSLELLSAEIAWSAPRSPQQWAKKFGVTTRTLRRWRCEEVIHPEEITKKLWSLPLSEVERHTAQPQSSP
jgi:hypothetical protein